MLEHPVYYGAAAPEQRWRAAQILVAVVERHPWPMPSSSPIVTPCSTNAEISIEVEFPPSWMRLIQTLLEKIMEFYNDNKEKA